MSLFPRKSAVIYAAAVLAYCAGTARAADLTAQEIANRSAERAYYQADNGRADVSMTITDRQGRTRERELTILRRDQTDGLGEQKYYVYFHEPSDVRGTVFLVWKYLDKSDDRWLYLPALDLVRRIAASDERTSFVGSHFFYEDVSGRSPTEDTHELVGEDATYYQLKSTPKNPGEVEFAYFVSYIDKETFIPVQTTYTDPNGEEYRIYRVEKVETIDGFPTVTRSRMRDLNREGETVLEYREVRYNTGIEEDIFEQRYLRNPPREVRR